MAGTVEHKLAAQGVVLHEPASPVANYVGFVRTGNLLFVSGQVCVNPEGKLIAKGKLGAGVTVEQGSAAARGCAINLLAQIKAAAVSALMPGRLVLSADQTLSLGDRRFSKPADRTAAREQLRALSGKTHRLYSAAVLMRDDTVLFDYGEAAELTMRELSDRFLEIYLDAAGEGATTSVGGYQIEATGAQLFGGVNGDYFTILGLPLLPLLDFLRRSGLIAA